MNLKLNSNKESKSEKKQIWMYALVLFTGAFIVLLLTAYSQVKFQNNISEYQNKLSSQEKAKLNAVTDFNSAVKENNRLKSELESLREKLVKAEQQIADLEQKGADLETKITNSTSAAEILLVAQQFYIDQDYTSCASTLKYDINTSYLSSKGLQMYNELKSKSYPKASLALYKKGYYNYKNRNYSEAILDLNRAIDFSEKNEFYIDDAYYYIAYSYYKTSNYVDAQKTIDIFVADYSDSSFLRKINLLKSKIG